MKNISFGDSKNDNFAKITSIMELNPLEISYVSGGIILNQHDYTEHLGMCLPALGLAFCGNKPKEIIFTSLMLGAAAGVSYLLHGSSFKDKLYDAYKVGIMAFTAGLFFFSYLDARKLGFVGHNIK